METTISKKPDLYESTIGEISLVIGFEIYPHLGRMMQRLKRQRSTTMQTQLSSRLLLLSLTAYSSATAAFLSFSRRARRLLFLSSLSLSRLTWPVAPFCRWPPSVWPPYILREASSSSRPIGSRKAPANFQLPIYTRAAEEYTEERRAKRSRASRGEGGVVGRGGKSGAAARRGKPRYASVEAAYAAENDDGDGGGDTREMTSWFTG